MANSLRTILDISGVLGSIYLLTDLSPNKIITANRTAERLDGDIEFLKYVISSDNVNREQLWNIATGLHNLSKWQSLDRGSKEKLEGMLIEVEGMETRDSYDSASQGYIKYTLVDYRDQLRDMQRIESNWDFSIGVISYVFGGILSLICVYDVFRRTFKTRKKHIKRFK